MNFQSNLVDEMKKFEKVLTRVLKVDILVK